MKPPKRTWYDSASAAQKLDCTVGDIEYYITEGHLRYAFATNNILNRSDLVLLRNQDLYRGISERLERLSRPDFLRCFEFTLERPTPTSVEPVEFLYLPHSWLSRMYVVDEDILDVRAHMFQLLDGSPVSIWRNGDPLRLHGERLGTKNQAGVLSDFIISSEELDLLGREENNEHIDENARAPERVIFEPPKKPNEYALAICDFANRYVKEYGLAPEGKALGHFMANHGKHEIGFTKIAQGVYDFNGKRMTQRQLSARLKSYRKEK